MSRARGRSVARWGITLVVMATTTALSSAAQEGPDAVRACETAAQASDWDAAVSHCEAALRALPDSYGIHYFLGFAHQARQDWTEAAASFESFIAAAEALPEDSARPDEQIGIAVRSAAVASFRAGDRERALPLLRRAAEADPVDAEVHFFLGVGLLEEDDRNGAEAAFIVVAREAPQISQAFFFLGQLRYDTGDYEAARDHLVRYLAADPAGPFRADAHWMAGSMAFRGSESAPPENPAARADGESEALLHFTALLAVEADSPRAAVAHYFLGTIAADREECETARRHYEAFLAIAPEHERATEVRGYLEEGFAPCGVSPGPEAAAKQSARFAMLC